jgi:hypothetical protein
MKDMNALAAKRDEDAMCLERTGDLATKEYIAICCRCQVSTTSGLHKDLSRDLPSSTY